MDRNIKVSVCVVTYNQEKYIAECLQSLVEQKTNFPFEVIVSDDCSTDNTRKIISDFYENYPNIIHPIFREVNLGGGRNYLETHAAASGKYIAHMDGDDYALPGKLQNQANFLDANPDCNIVWHPVFKITPYGQLISPSDKDSLFIYNNKFYRHDLIKLGAIGKNSSKMYRANIRDFVLPPFDVMDYFANVEQVGKGYAAFSSIEPLGAYRLGIGISSNGSKTRITLIKSVEFFFNKYPTCRTAVNSIAIVLFLGDLIRRRPTLKSSLALFLKSFSWISILKFPKDLFLIKRL